MTRVIIRPHETKSLNISKKNILIHSEFFLHRKLAFEFFLHRKLDMNFYNQFYRYSEFFFFFFNTKFILICKKKCPTFREKIIITFSDKVQTICFHEGTKLICFWCGLYCWYNLYIKIFSANNSGFSVSTRHPVICLCGTVISLDTNLYNLRVFQWLI